MTYSEWNKKVRRNYLQIARKMNIKNLDVLIVEDHKNGVHINPRKNRMVIPFTQMEQIKRETGYSCSEVEIATIYIYHELGHYLYYRRNPKEVRKEEYHRHELLMKGVFGKEYSSHEKLDFLTEYKRMLMKCEMEAWELGACYFEGDKEWFKAIMDFSIKSHASSCNAHLRYEMKKIQEKKEAEVLPQ